MINIIKFLIVVSMILLGTDLIYNQVVNGSPDMNANESAINEAMNKAKNELMNEANKVIAGANASNITDANISEFDDELDDNSGVGYYSPNCLQSQTLQ